jgi:HD superfamily phosphohydrolase YqeK
VVETIERVTAGWSESGRDAAARAAWYHDAWKCDRLEDMLAEIRAGGEEADPWALRHAPVLIHAQAAAVWARRAMGEADAEVLLAVRHHPTGHPDWSAIGRALYVADFCEPGRPFAEPLGTAAIAEGAVAGSEALADAALAVLAIRLGRALESRRPLHPDGWRAWNAWSGAGEA